MIRSCAAEAPGAAAAAWAQLRTETESSALRLLALDMLHLAR